VDTKQRDSLLYGSRACLGFTIDRMQKRGVMTDCFHPCPGTALRIALAAFQNSTIYPTGSFVYILQLLCNPVKLSNGAIYGWLMKRG